MTPPLGKFTRRERAQLYWVTHRWVDVALGLLVVVVWYVVAANCWLPQQYCGLPQALTAVPGEGRRLLYQILAAAAATMGGFTLTSVSILVNLLRTPMTAVDRLLPAGDKRRVGSVFLGVLPWLLALFVASLICLATDANVAEGYELLQLATVGITVSAVLSLARVVWVLRRLLSVSTD